ncbi:potassium-transporting ATPase subunit C [Flavobacterium sp. TAB 87]|uniref:potassium-transporting ATPase subunit C n=1 Tax=Flavobacterium sp. TAB 87 TaxID=1729581 RepID=UPI00076C0190|nr:potassium-transporting ATPase subunit C [Flavobacterium sp. TAB 87]KVV14811.1 Potassium-transporting ATPase C chain [Flavobacterium sp. TAB 87]
MKKIILIAVCTFFIGILFGVRYPFILSVFDAFNSDQKIDTVVLQEGKSVKQAAVNSNFNQNIYFWKHPSLSDYRSVNLENNSIYVVKTDSLEEVDSRIKAALLNRTTQKTQHNALTKSQNKLDCDISIEDAMIQVPRIAKTRNINVNRIDSLVLEYSRTRIIGILGPKQINMMFLNTELDKLK